MYNRPPECVLRKQEYRKVIFMWKTVIKVLSNRRNIVFSQVQGLLQNIRHIRSPFCNKILFTDLLKNKCRFQKNKSFQGISLKQKSLQISSLERMIFQKLYLEIFELSVKFPKIIKLFQDFPRKYAFSQRKRAFRVLL